MIDEGLNFTLVGLFKLLLLMKNHTTVSGVEVVNIQLLKYTENIFSNDLQG